MKVVFLDVDGVLNGFLLWPNDAGRRWIDPQCVCRLNAITHATGAQIVVTSTWRRHGLVAQMLKDAGVDAPIIGETPYIPGGSRGHEISAWLVERNGNPLEDFSFVILDDDSDMNGLSHALVQTEWSFGLEDKHVVEAIAKLS